MDHRNTFASRAGVLRIAQHKRLNCCREGVECHEMTDLAALLPELP